ncbi:MAG: O-antigen ligase family protein [Anaerolineae bacterium]
MSWIAPLGITVALLGAAWLLASLGDRLCRAAAPVRPAPAWVPTAQTAAFFLLAPVLWFPEVRPQATCLALALLALLVGVVGLAHRSLWAPTPFDPALALLAAMALVGILRSPVPALTLPKAASLLLGLVLLRALAERTGNPARHLRTSLAVLAALAIGFAVIGLLGGLRADKVPQFGALLARVPRFVQSLPGTQGGRVSLNQLGGALLYVLPVSLAVVCAPLRHVDGDATPWSLRLAALAVTLVLGSALVLTQSRSAWLGLVAGLLCLMGLRWAWGRWLLLALAIGGLAWLLVAGQDFLREVVVQVLTARVGPQTPFGRLTLSGRITIWNQALAYIQASPWLGYGLGVYRAMGLDPAAPTATLLDAGLPHAHNAFLQVAFDLGLPGLVAYLALLLGAARTCWGALHLPAPHGLRPTLAAGCLAALLAVHVYGLTDVVALGAKPGVLWWGLLGLVALLRAPALAPASAPSAVAASAATDGARATSSVS